MTAMALEPGQSPPLAVITPNDQRGVIFVTGWFALAATLICLVVRAYVRVGFGQAIGRDDYAITASFVSSPRPLVGYVDDKIGA